MSGWAEERRVLTTWFAAQWAALSAPINTATVPVEYEGQVFDPPAAGGAYVQMFLVGATEGTQITLGTPALSRYVGMVQFTINCPIGKDGGANALAREIADRLDTLWKGRRFQMTSGRIRCRVPGLHTLGQVNERWIAVLTVPYLRDENADIPAAVLLGP